MSRKPRGNGECSRCSAPGCKVVNSDVGMSGIGQALAQRARVWSGRVPQPVPWRPISLPLDARRCDLDELLATSDVVSLIARTASKRITSLMECFKCNAKRRSARQYARGPIVDEAALVEGLSNGEIGAAALDVFEREPEFPGLLGLDNTVLVHISDRQQSKLELRWRRSLPAMWSGSSTAEDQRPCDLTHLCCHSLSNLKS